MSLRTTQAALLLAAAGAILILVGILGTVAALIGLAFVLAGTVLAAPAGREGVNGWWSLLAIGAALSAAGALLSVLSESIGGLVGLLGGIAVLSASALGFPVDEG